MSVKSKNYEILREYIGELHIEEKYALLTHYIQLQNSNYCNTYREELLKYGVDLSKVPLVDIFNVKH